MGERNEMVWVVTNPEYGWDCVIGVYRDREKAVEVCANFDGIPVEEWEESLRKVLIIHKQLLD